MTLCMFHEQATGRHNTRGIAVGWLFPKVEGDHVKMSVIMIMALTVIGCADEPIATSGKEVRQIYDTALQKADAERSMALKSAQDAYIKQLQGALDAAFENKNLKEANEIDAAMKSMEKKSVPFDSRVQWAVSAKESFEAALKAMNAKHREDYHTAKTQYRKHLGRMLDEALAEKHLDEANRIQTELKEIELDSVSPAMNPTLVEVDRDTAAAFDHGAITQLLTAYESTAFAERGQFVTDPIEFAREQTNYYRNFDEKQVSQFRTVKVVSVEESGGADSRSVGNFE